MRDNKLVRLLTYVTGLVNQELLLQNEYLAVENRILAYAERWVLSAKQECLSKLILFGEGSFRRALREFIDHFHTERNHQGKSNVLLFPSDVATPRPHNGAVLCRERLGGLLKYYCCAA